MLIGMQMGNLVRRGERTTAPRSLGSGVGWIHRSIVVHRGNRGAGHGMPIRISPCVRPICCEPVDSTHPDTQGRPQETRQESFKNRVVAYALSATTTDLGAIWSTFARKDSQVANHWWI